MTINNYLYSGADVLYDNKELYTVSTFLPPDLGGKTKLSIPLPPEPLHPNQRLAWVCNPLTLEINIKIKFKCFLKIKRLLGYLSVNMCVLI